MRFLLVDKIYELEPGKRIRASKVLPASEEIFRDHFPGFAVVPGVLLTEMMAQAAGKCLDSEGTHPGRAILARISSASFRSWVKPDEEAIIHAEISQNRLAYATANCFIEVGGKRICSAELFFVFFPHEQFAPGYRDEVVDAYWRAHPQMPPAGVVP
jgi:3-hydroxyacyl-[acyl-carrier-protein] dehydratase